MAVMAARPLAVNLDIGSSLAWMDIGPEHHRPW